MCGSRVCRKAVPTGTRILLLPCVAAVVLVGCGGPASLPRAGWEAPGGSAAGVAIHTFQFQPPTLVVNAGTRVTWTNTDDIEHTVTSGTPESRDGRFNSPLDGKNSTFDFTFTEAGTYTYFCDRHNHMRGEIRVN